MYQHSATNRRSRYTCLLATLLAITTIFQLAPTEKQEAEQTFLESHVGRPVMILDNFKGLTNQRSYALTGLQLASLLRWSIALPRIHTPVDGCVNMSTICMKYSTFQEVNFSDIYDETHFVRTANRLGVFVHKHIPAGYQTLPEHSWPCARHGRCFNTIEGLLSNFEQLRGRILVRAPGIGAGVVDSTETADHVRLINRAFVHNSQILLDAERIFQHLSELGVVVAIHYRFEPDAVAVNYAGDVLLFGRRLSQFIEAIYSEGQRIVLFFVSGISLNEIRNSHIMKEVTERFPSALFANKQNFTSLNAPSRSSPNSFVRAALDFELSLRAHHFVGIARSSFSSFVALGRRDLYERSARHLTALLPPNEQSEICALKDAHVWQFELQLPVNECVVRDPCDILMLLPGHPDERPVCKFNLPHALTGHCSGMAGSSLNCTQASTL